MSWNDDPVVTTAESWQEDPIEPFSLTKTVKNIPSDIKGLATGAFNIAKPVVDPLGITESAMKGSFDPMIERATGQTGREAFKQAVGIPGGLIEEGKRIGAGELLTGHPINAANKFTSALQEKPVSTALDVLPFAAPFMKGAKAAPLAEEAPAAAAAAIPEASTAGLRSAVKLRGKTYVGEPGEIHADVINKMAKELGENPDTVIDAVNKIGDQGFTKGDQFLSRQEAAAQTGVKGEAASMRAAGKLEPEKGTFETLKDKIPQDIMDPMKQVGSYLEKQYGKAAEKPGFAGTIGELLARKAKGMRLKEMGMSPGQARKIVERFGEGKLMELSDIAKEKNITKPILGYKVGERIKDLTKESGQKIGQFRKIASEKGAIHNVDSLVKTIREKLDPEYLGKGTNSSQKGAYLKALEDIKAHASTPEKLAQKISDMNDFATKNKMTQATGAITDVANAASKANNELIGKYLNPAEMEAYRSSLKDFGASKIFNKFYGFKVGREFAGRSGPGSILKNMYQWGMDTFGNKFVENVSEGVGNKLKKNPGLALKPQVLVDEVLKQMADTLDEIGDEVVQ